MQDFIYIPKSLALSLLSLSAPWEHVESVISLLTVAAIREPYEQVDDYSRYMIRGKEVRGRFSANVPFHQYGFLLDENPIPFISDFKPSKGDGSVYSYEIHTLVNPCHYNHRHLMWDDLKAFSINLWKMPRHVLIRWRYSCRIPVYKSNFQPKVKFSSEGYEIPDGFPSANKLFSETANIFFDLLCRCDESSLAYAFCCHTFFFVHDRLLHLLRSSREDDRFFQFLGQLHDCVLKASKSQEHPSAVVAMLEGLFRGILPNSLFARHPFNVFSDSRFVAEPSTDI